jgi:hypothetical protein
MLRERRCWEGNKFFPFLYVICGLFAHPNLRCFFVSCATNQGGEAVLIGERKDERHDIKLYQIDGFYIEEYFDRVRNARVKFESFSSTELLDVYLDQFNIIIPPEI